MTTPIADHRHVPSGRFTIPRPYQGRYVAMAICEVCEHPIPPKFADKRKKSRSRESEPENVPELW